MTIALMAFNCSSRWCTRRASNHTVPQTHGLVPNGQIPSFWTTATRLQANALSHVWWCSQWQRRSLEEFQRPSLNEALQEAVTFGDRTLPESPLCRSPFGGWRGGQLDARHLAHATCRRMPQRRSWEDVFNSTSKFWT